MCPPTGFCLAVVGPSSFKFQFNPERFKIVSEIKAVEKQMRHTFDIFFTNKTNGTVSILEPL